MTIAPLDLLLLLGSLQGVILATILWFSRKGNRLSNRLLAGLLGLLALMSWAVGTPIPNPFVSLLTDVVPFINVMPLGPLIFFYAKSVIDPQFRLGRAERLHFCPVVLDWGGTLIAWTFLVGVTLGVFSPQDRPTWERIVTEYNTYVDIPRWMSVAVYLLLARRWLNRQQPTSQDPEALRLPHAIRWLRQFLNVFLVFQVLWLVHLVPYIVPATRAALLQQFGWYPIYIPIAFLIYWLGLKGYLHARSEVAVATLRKTAPPTLPPEVAVVMVERLRHAMEADRLFLDTELTVEKVGKHLGIAPKIISSVLNGHLRKSFNTFINEYRVEAVKQRLTDPTPALTLTGTAFECGFNSQATFQRTFRQQTGLSPTEYRNRLVKNNAQIRI